MEHINANGSNLARCSVTKPFFLCLSENIACKSLHKVIVSLLTTPKMQGMPHPFRSTVDYLMKQMAWFNKFIQVSLNATEHLVSLAKND